MAGSGIFAALLSVLKIYAMDGMNRRILALAIPNIISNITIPLLGMVDTAIAGRLGEGTAAIGAIGIGTAIFNMIYWLCGFIRMGTSGITAQAYGARNLRECTDILVRSMSVALALSALLLALQYPVGRLAFGLMSGSEGAERLAGEYFFARIWAAPADIMLFAMHGWFIGMQNSKTPMTVSILSNIINVIFSLLFVYRFDMGIAGIAWGTVVAQYSGLVISLVFWRAFYWRLARYINLRAIAHMKAMTRFFHINKDIFLRTLCIVAAYTFFTAASSRLGDTVLAANTLLMQLFTLFSYMSDGFAYAAESLAGRYIGAGSRQLLKQAIRRLFIWSFGLALLYVTVYGIFWREILSLFGPDADVLDTAGRYVLWVIAIPLVGCLPFLIDGIMLGATRTKVLRNTMFGSVAIYFVLYYSTASWFGNNAVWLAFVGFIAVRGILLMAATGNLDTGRLIQSGEKKKNRYNATKSLKKRNIND